MSKVNTTSDTNGLKEFGDAFQTIGKAIHEDGLKEKSKKERKKKRDQKNNDSLKDAFNQEVNDELV